MGVYNNNKDGTRSTIANTIQVVDAPIEQFVSRGEFNAVVPSDTSADNKLVNDDKFDTNLNDIWKVQGELGAKNLIPYPYYDSPKTHNGIAYTVNDDGSINMNGTSTAYSTFHIFRQVNGFKKGNYTISCEGLIQGVVFQFGTVIDGTFRAVVSCSETIPSKTLVIDSTYDDVIVGLRMMVNPQIIVGDNLTVYPMLRYASDTDDTWQPYVPTNKTLSESISAQISLIGVYLPNATNTSSKKVVANVGQTIATFNANSFMSRYNVTASDLDLDISAKTSSGDIVSYKNVNITGGIVTVTFDALAEQTTFICKCSVIQ